MGYVGKSVGYVGKSVGYVGESVGYAAITHTFQPMKSIRSDVPWYKYIYYIGAWNGPIKLVRRGGIYFDVPPQCSTPDTAHGQWVRRYGYSSSS